MQRFAPARRALAAVLSIMLVVGLWPSGAAFADNDATTGVSPDVAASDAASSDSESTPPAAPSAAEAVNEGSAEALEVRDSKEMSESPTAQPTTMPSASGGEGSEGGMSPAVSAPGTGAVGPSSGEAAAGTFEPQSGTGAVAPSPESATELSPAIDYLGRIGGVCVRLHAPEGAFPSGTTVGVRPADSGELVAATEGLLAGEAVDARAVDISFVREGVELQPSEGHEVRVSLLPDEKLKGECFSAVHLSHGSAEVVAPAVSTCATFSADSFSIYGIVGENASRRLQVTFKSGGGDALDADRARRRHARGARPLRLAPEADALLLGGRRCRPT